jgi:hypothetical protein
LATVIRFCVTCRHILVAPIRRYHIPKHCAHESCSVDNVGFIEAVHSNESIIGVFGAVKPLGGSKMTGDDMIAYTDIIAFKQPNTNSWDHVIFSGTEGDFQTG